MLGYYGNQMLNFNIWLNIKLVSGCLLGDGTRKEEGFFLACFFYSVRWSRGTLVCACKRLWFVSSDALIVSKNLLLGLERLQISVTDILGFWYGT